MYYTLESLQKAFQNGEKFHYIFFWGNQPSKDGSITKSCLSQWWECKFTVNDVSYSSTEQWMMAEKAKLFKDDLILGKILNSNSPSEIKKYGREIKNFQQDIWNDKKLDIVIIGNYYKFKQNEKLSNYLISTNPNILVEASPVDKIWGIGLEENDPLSRNPMNWKGENLLGFALMKVRDKILSELKE